jgi:thiamine biosynthesis protein ThiI
MPLFLLRYAEIGLKSERVRSRFIKTLIENIENAFLSKGIECIISSDRGRIYVLSENANEGRDIISRTFGIASFSEVIEAPVSLEELVSSVSNYASQLLEKGCTFAVRARRSGGQKYTSMELAREAGSRIMRDHPTLELKVSLDDPEVEVFVEARDKASYIYGGSEDGPGGLPMGTQGKVACLVEKSDDIVIPWLMMRRGCSVIVGSIGDADMAPMRKWNPAIEIVHTEGMEQLLSLASQNQCSGIALNHEKLIQTDSPAEKSGFAFFYPTTGMTAGELQALLARIR